MKPLKHYLVPELRLRKNTNYDLMWLLYRTVGINYSDYEAISSNILCLTLLAGYISFEELTYLLGLPEKTPMSLWQELDYLKKKGLLLTTTITQDSLTRNVYYLSAYGFQMTANKFNDLTISYKRRGKTTTVMHDYSAGMNLFHLILFKHSFLYKREESVGVSAKTGRDTVNTLRIDAVCSFKDTPYVLYIEQDMGNEKTSVLVDKLDKYKEYGLMDIPMEDAVVFSIKKPGDTVKNDIYNKRALDALISSVKAFGLKSVDAYIKRLKSASPAELTVHKDHLGLAEKIAEKVKMYKNDGSLKFDMTVDDLSEFREGLDSGKNDYRMMDINDSQYRFCDSKMHSVLGVIIKKYRDTDAIQSYMYAFTSGYSVWCVPTVLLSNYLPFICPLLSELKKTFDIVMGKADSRAVFDKYVMGFEERLSRVNKDPRPLCLRNIYRSGSRIYAFEYISKDVGGFFRALYLRNNYLKETGYDITLVMIVDSLTDAILYSSEIYLDCRGLDDKGNVRMCFITKFDLSFGNAQFFFINETGNRQVFYLN